MSSDKWENFARESAEYYVDTSYASNGNGKEHFFEGGENFTQATLSRAKKYLPDWERALEIGAGVGRLTLPHAKVFNEVIAVDAAPTMLSNLKENAVNRGVQNIQTYLPSEDWESHNVSYAYSYLVFQHIEEIEVIEDYVRRMTQCLKKKGIAQLQFDTRSQGLLYRLRNNLPDAVLPKNQKQGIRRIRRQPGALSGMFQDQGLVILEEMHPNTNTHTYLLKKL